MQISRVISGFCVALALSCSSPAHSEDGLPSDVISSETPAPVAEKPVVAKPVEKKSAAKSGFLKKKISAKAAATKILEAKTASTAKKPSAPAATTASTSEQQLKIIDQHYQSAKSITMDVERKLVIGLLGKEKNAKGTLTLAKGKMRLELAQPEKSIVVVNGQSLWVADYPPAEFKNAAVQVLKGTISSKKGASQSFASLLTRGALLKEFSVTGTQQDEQKRTIFFLQPKNQTSEFKRAQLVASADGKTISELRYWDERDNATTMIFTNVEFDKPVAPKTFDFTPPENADVTTI
jgi:outer membrane lipoprotein carrier protein